MRFMHWTILLLTLTICACTGDTADTAASEPAAEHDEATKSPQMSTRIDAAMARESGIETATAGPAVIRETLVLHGTIVPDPQRVFRLQARFPGVVKEVRKRIGETVRADDVLAVIEANESLQRYNIISPAAGVVVAREVNPGAAVEDESLLTVVDLTTVWVELAAFQHDMGRIFSDQSVIVRDVDGHQSTAGRIENIAPVGSAASQSMTARVALSNPDGLWRPGLFVTGEVTVAETEAPVAVYHAAVQDFRGGPVVFEQVGEEYVARPVTLGRKDADRAEVLSGIKPGAQYVSAGSYLIKSDLEKAGVEHDD